MVITSMHVKKFIAVMMIIGPLISGSIFVVQVGMATLLMYLIPSAVIFGVLLFMIGSGIAYLQNPMSSAREQCLSVSLVLQTIHFSIFGLSYKVFFGPYLGLDFIIEPVFRLDIEFNLLAFRFLFGYHTGDPMMVGVNFIPVLLLVLIGYLEKKEKKQRDEQELF
ncbi:MAG: hypothetical protein DI535_21400 [Citrobacter freundii]|nr:MAG: hypothetical protein DI535_21400 [Citrobacter freundii]